MYPVEEIRENYKKFSDSKIEQIATIESKCLRKEVLEILKDEIIKRGLDKDLITWVNAEADTFSEVEISLLIKQIQNLSCPSCSQKSGDLGGYEINKIVSVLFFTKETTNRKIICAKCGHKEKINSIMITILAGWWSKKGIFLTPYILIKDLVNLFYSKKISNLILNEFIEYNTGVIRLIGTEDKEISQLLLSHNNREFQ